MLAEYEQIEIHPMPYPNLVPKYPISEAITVNIVITIVIIIVIEIVVIIGIVDHSSVIESSLCY